MGNELEQKIMKQVTRTYYLKKVFNPLMFKIYALGIAFVGISSLVSVSNVFKNMPSLLDFGSVFRFVNSAIVNTELTVQLVLGVAVVIGVLLIRDTIKNFSYSGKLATNHIAR
jgi:hypothetical protein